MFVYRYFVHLKKVRRRYRKRIVGAVKFIFDFKILFFSLIYILSTCFFLKILRNINDNRTIGLFSQVTFLIFLLMAVFSLLRNIPTGLNKDSVTGSKGKECWNYFVHFLVPLIIILIALTKVAGVVVQENVTMSKVAGFTDERVSFEGYVYVEVDRKHRFQHLMVKQLQDISVGDVSLSKNHGYLLVKTENYEKFSIGQVCKFSGTLVEPESFSDFDYKQYLRNKKVFLILENPNYYCWSTEERRAGSKFSNMLIDFKGKIIQDIDDILHEPQSSLLAGILFGQKRLFSNTFEENTRLSGVSHIVAASGYNITILVLLINKTFFFLPKRWKIIIGLIVIWSFALLSGLSSSIIRACIMSTLSLMALLFGRGNSIHISLFLTAAIFIFFEPLIIFDVGFLLSMAATLGLVYILPVLVDVRKKFFKKLKFFDDYVFPTFSCTVSTLPISLITFGTFSVWSVPVNVVILPVIETTMLWGVLSLLLINIHKPLSYFLMLLADLQLKYFEYIVNSVGRLNIGSWEVLGIEGSVLAIVILSLLLLLTIYFYPIENEKYNWYIKNS